MVLGQTMGIERTAWFCIILTSKSGKLGRIQFANCFQSQILLQERALKGQKKKSHPPEISKAHLPPQDREVIQVLTYVVSSFL